MSNLTIYHGSPIVVECPLYGFGKMINDYGQGFYCTEHIELAKEWACSEGTDGFVNTYEIDTTDLKILFLTEEKYSILNWLALLVDNRRLRLSSPVMEKGVAWLKEHFLPDISDYDVIVGYRADDSYFSFARAFLNNTISVKQLSYAMKLGKLGEQMVLKSEKAFAAIKFVSAEMADNRIYYPRRRKRDEDARMAFLAELESDDVSGIYMRDIIREGMKNDDGRIQ